jgi:serine/threonine protein kinase
MITPGSRLGSYEVIARLGAGGMGEVWRAKDTTLDRDVALKFLPASVAEDGERLARFDREANLRGSTGSTTTPASASSPWSWSPGRISPSA